MPPLSGDVLRQLVDQLALAVLIFRDHRLIYRNQAAELLRARLWQAYRIQLDVVLQDQWSAWRDQLRQNRGERGPIVALLTATSGEPFYVHVIPLASDREMALTVRVIGAEMEAVRRRYGLSARESQVAELVLHGYRNIDIALALGMAPATAKKHLTRIFDKVGVNTRSQLQTRLA